MSNDLDLGERIAVLETQIKTVIERQQYVLNAIETIQKTLAEIRGGTSMLVWIGSAGAAVGAFAIEMWHKLR